MSEGTKQARLRLVDLSEQLRTQSMLNAQDLGSIDFHAMTAERLRAFESVYAACSAMCEAASRLRGIADRLPE